MKCLPVCVNGSSGGSVGGDRGDRRSDIRPPPLSSHLETGTAAAGTSLEERWG